MYVDLIPQPYMDMYRSIVLMEFAETALGLELHEYQEAFFLEIATRTNNKCLMDPNFCCFPVTPDYIRKTIKVSNAPTQNTVH